MLLTSLVIFSGCTEVHKEDAVHDNAIKVDELSDDIKVPTKVWDSMWENAQNFIFADVRVILKEKNPGVLVKPEIEIQYPVGGGRLNLREYLTGKAGTFYLNFKFPEFEDAKERRVFFISNAKKRKIGQDIYGTGCNKFLDITKSYFANFSKDGIKLNTTRARHLTVAGGTFIFASNKEERNFVSQLTLTDSDFVEMLCEGGI